MFPGGIVRILPIGSVFRIALGLEGRQGQKTWWLPRALPSGDFGYAGSAASRIDLHPAMVHDKLRRRIASEAARLLYSREENEYFRAKWLAARRVCSRTVRAGELPTNREVREEIHLFARAHRGERRDALLREMRLAALELMHLLRGFRPRLVGRTLTGSVRRGSQIDLMAFADDPRDVAAALAAHGLACEVEPRPLGRDGQVRPVTRLLFVDRFPVAVLVYRAAVARRRFRSAATGRPISRASIGELARLLCDAPPHVPQPQTAAEATGPVDRFLVYQMLLSPLENVRQSPQRHPEGDALYHSLQVFDLAREAIPYDEEFLLAALLHDVGKAIDPKDHVRAGLEALDGFITPRTAWFIEQKRAGLDLIEGTIGRRARRRLEAAEDYDELLLLARCDRAGRRRGVATADVEDALHYLRELAEMCG